MGASFPTATITVLFVDCTASTARLTRLGDNDGDVFRRRLFVRLGECVTETGGSVVKNLGDGLMVVFERSTVGALVCARLMHERIGDLDADDPVELRIGISVGEVVAEDGDWFGTPVVEAARLCGAAASGQTLAPALLGTLVGSRAAAHRFRPIGRIELKGLRAPLDVVEVDGSSPAGTDSAARRSACRRRRALGVAAVLATVLTVVVVGLRTSQPSSREGAVAARSARGKLTAPAGYTPVLKPTECDAKLREAAPTVECSELIVPESRSAPDGPTLALPVAELAGPEDGGLDPVILVDNNEPVTRTTLDDVTTVFALTPRGFAGVARKTLRCPTINAAWKAALAEPADAPAAIDSKVEAAATCFAALRGAAPAPASLNLDEVADDVRDLVVALKRRRVSVAAGGVFALSASAFARRQPEAVSSMILTNPVPPGESGLAEPARSLAMQFAALADQCGEDRGCARDYPDLEATYRKRSDALTARPVPVSTRALDGQGPYDVLLDGPRFATALGTSMQSSTQLGLVPSGVVAASDELVAGIAISGDIGIFVGENSWGPVFLSLACSYDQRSSRLGEISARTFEQFAADPTLPAACEAWAVPSVFDELSAPLEVDVPVLLIEGALSVAGVNKWAGQMASSLPDSIVVRFPTLSDDVATAAPPCLRTIRARFLRDPASVTDPGTCEADSPPIDFVGAD